MKPFFQILISGLILGFVLSGCAVDQAKEVQLYRQVLDGDHPAPLPYETKEPLSLSHAMQLANVHNEQLAMTGETYLQAVIAKDRAFANFLPTLTFIPSFLRQEKIKANGSNAFLADIVPDKALDLPIEGKLSLKPFRDVPLQRAAIFNIDKQKALLLDQQSVLMLDVAQTYLQIMRSEEQTKVLQQSLEVQQQRLQDTQVKLKVGVMRPVDVSLAEAQLASVRKQLIQAQADTRNSRALLAYLIGVPAVEGPLSHDVTIPSATWDVEQQITCAENNRQDLKGAQAQVKISMRQLESAWGEYFPTVSLNLTKYFSRETFPNEVEWTSLLKAEVPLFSGGLVHADVRNAYSHLRQAHLEESNLRRQIIKDLKVAIEDLESDAEQIEQLRIQIKAANEADKKTAAELQTGIGTKLNHLIAQNTVLTTQLEMTTEKYKRYVDYLRLLRTTGTLDPYAKI